MVMNESAVFEAEVRRIARQLFPSAGAYGGVILDGRERDGVINTGEAIHIIEATCDPRKLKAQNDIDKSIDLKKLLTGQFPDHNFKIWFITQNDPTADQSAVAEAARKKARCPVVAMSLRAFSQRLVDADGYIAARSHYQFGSVRHPDPSSPLKDVPEGEFVPIDLVEKGTNIPHHPDTIVNAPSNKTGIVLIVGSFGAGKSMTMRHMYLLAKSHYQKRYSQKFPVFLNLRDHIGQDEPSSALFDHGTRIGFKNPEQLVRSWRSGFVHLFLDGFDEISSSRFRSDSSGLREVRRRAMALVRRFVESHREFDTSIYISGRGNYFSSWDEMEASLGIKNREHSIYMLNEFTTEQVREYLRRLKVNDDVIPDWLPSRPLLIGYLATRGIITKDASILANLSRSEGWDFLLDRICEREGGQIDALGGQAHQVRDYVDRLATKARHTTSGRGPLATTDLSSLFHQIFPTSPDDAAQQLLLRMAGLTAAASSSTMAPSLNSDQDAREFVDDDLVDVARSGDISRFVRFTYDKNIIDLFMDKSCIAVCGDIGIEVAAKKLADVGHRQVCAAFERAIEIGSPALSFDILRVMEELSISYEPTSSSRSASISDGYFPAVEISGACNFSNVLFDQCLIDELVLTTGAQKDRSPRFKNCIISSISGAASLRDVPPEILIIGNDILEFKNDFETNDEVREQVPDVPVRVLIVSLRKLFLQSGGGRKETAFFRGLDDAEKVFVSDVLELISTFNFAKPSNSRGQTIWVPNRTKRGDAIAIIQAPKQSEHPLLNAIRQI